MKNSATLTCAAIGALAFFAAPVHAVTVSLDPTNLLAPGFISVGEWNTNGDFEGWSQSNVINATVSGGFYNGDVADGNNDPNPLRQNFQGLGIDLDSGNFDVIEIRISRTAPASRFDFFWGTTVANGISGTRRAEYLSLPDDGAFHIVQFDMSDEADWTATLDDLRFDPYSGTAPGGSNRSFQVDYIRVGAPIPEPTGVALMGLGGLALIARRRRK